MTNDSEKMINIKINIAVTLMLLSLCFSNANAQLSEKYTNYEELEYNGLKYGFYKPPVYDESKSYPLVLVLNGFNDTISHDFVYYEQLFQKNNPSFVISPKCHGNPYEGGGWVNPSTDTLLSDGKTAIEILESVIQNYKIDTNRLYIHGGSMGGFGTFGILSNFPERFAAAYVVCGGAKMETATNFMNTPLWIFHGQMDDVVPVHLSRNIYNEIIKHGGEKVRYTVYPGVKHNSWENASQEKTLKTWLFKQELGKTSDNPSKPEGLTIESTQFNNVLKWKLPSVISSVDNEIWYYIILRNDEVLVEVDGDVSMYTDVVRLDNDYYSYRIIAVNYYFKKSESSESVRIMK